MGGNCRQNHRKKYKKTQKKGMNRMMRMKRISFSSTVEDETPQPRTQDVNGTVLEWRVQGHVPEKAVPFPLVRWAADGGGCRKGPFFAVLAHWQQHGNAIMSFAFFVKRHTQVHWLLATKLWVSRIFAKKTVLRGKFVIQGSQPWYEASQKKTAAVWKKKQKFWPGNFEINF